MKKVELLAPAGSLATLKVAIEAGADAVYIAGEKFGARAFAKNFTEEELIMGVNFAHERRAKVYVTVNTIIYEKEFNELAAYLKFLYEINVDAVIVQDLGVLTYLRTTFPNFLVHASTQMNINNQNDLKILADLGVNRVILARELSLDEIKKWQPYPLELEVFVQGALCFCASGNCLMSYKIGGRSGNRGMCAQPCRKLYDLKEDDKVIIKNRALLSMKDLYTLDHLNELIDAGITSFKIEGRMKSDEYVYMTVKAYKEAIDHYYQKQTFNDYDYQKKIKTVFNREFTKGFLLNDDNSSLTNHQNVNHQGLLIGKVVKQTPKSIEILLTDEVMVGDALRINTSNPEGFYLQKMFVNNIDVKIASPTNIIKIPYQTEAKLINKEVVKTKSASLQQELTNYLKTEHCKTKIEAKLVLKIDDYAYLTLDDGQNKVTICSKEIIKEVAETPLTKDFYQTRLDKFTSTPFYLENFSFEYDKKAFLQVKELNNLRRLGILQLLNYRQSLVNRTSHNFNILTKSYEKEIPSYEAIVHTKDQYLACQEASIKTIYTDYMSDKMVLSTFDKQSLPNAMIHHLGNFSRNNTASSAFNVVNISALNFLKDFGFSKIYLSNELTIDDIRELHLPNIAVNVGWLIYGRMNLMVAKHCLVAKCKNHLNKGCNNCTKHLYRLIDQYHNELPLLFDPQNECSMRILDYQVTNRLDQIKQLINLGLNLFLLTFTTESYEETKEVLKKLKTL